MYNSLYSKNATIWSTPLTTQSPRRSPHCRRYSPCSNFTQTRRIWHNTSFNTPKSTYWVYSISLYNIIPIRLAHQVFSPRGRVSCVGYRQEGLGAILSSGWGYELPPYLVLAGQLVPSPARLCFLIQADIHPSLTMLLALLCGQSLLPWAFLGYTASRYSGKAFWLEMLGAILSSESGYNSAPLPVGPGALVYKVSVQARFFIWGPKSGRTLCSDQFPSPSVPLSWFCR